MNRMVVFGLLAMLMLGVNVFAAPVHKAAEIGDVQKLERLFQEAPNQIDAQDGWGWTPLMYAVRERQIDMVTFLLKHGARVSVTDKDLKQNAVDQTRSYIDRCSEDYIQKQAAFWKRQGATEDQIAERIAIHKKNHGPEDELKWKQIEAMLSQALAKELTIDHESPLLNAVIQNDIDEVTRLLDAGSYTEVKDEIGRTPLMLAVIHGETDIAQVLLEHGANMSERDLEGRTPYSSARQMFEIFAHARRERDHQDVQALVVQGKLDINARDENGETALMRAVAEGRWEDVKFLIGIGAATDIKNNAGESLTEIACTRMCSDQIKERILEAIAQPARGKHDAAGNSDDLK